MIAVLVPAGAYRWAALALALAGAALAVAATRVPREARAANVALVVCLGCAVGAIWVAEFFPFDERFTPWMLGVTGLPVTRASSTSKSFPSVGRRLLDAAASVGAAGGRHNQPPTAQCQAGCGREIVATSRDHCDDQLLPIPAC